MGLCHQDRSRGIRDPACPKQDIGPPRLQRMTIEFSEDERATLIDLLVGIIEHDPLPLSQRIQRLRSILRKLRPAPELPREEPDEIDDEPPVL
jgi:hypothetical protein